MAIKSQTTIAQIAPKIKESLQLGYPIPKPIEAKKVLSPKFSYHNT